MEGQQTGIAYSVYFTLGGELLYNRRHGTCPARRWALKGNLGQLENRQMQSSERWAVQLDEGVLEGVKQRNLSV